MTRETGDCNCDEMADDVDIDGWTCPIHGKVRFDALLGVVVPDKK
jgi:hypothetical protein